MIIANGATVVITPASTSSMRQLGLQPSPVGIGVIVVCAITNIAFAVALLRWHKWGLYGILATTVIALITNLSLGFGIGQCLLGLVGIGLLFWLLNMGGENKAWPRLQ